MSDTVWKAEWRRVILADELIQKTKAGREIKSPRVLGLNSKQLLRIDSDFSYRS